MAQNAENNEKKIDGKGILKKVGKVLVLVIVTVAIAVGSVFGLAACNNTNSGSSITPVTPPAQTITVAQAIDSNPANVTNFVKNVVDEVTDGYKDSDLLYVAYDIKNKDKTVLNTVNVTMTSKGSGNERIVEVKKASFKDVDAIQLRDGKGELVDLFIEDVEEVKYNDTNYQRYASLYEIKHDGVVVEFKGNQFTESSHQSTIVSTADFLAENAVAADKFGDKIAKAVLNHYQYDKNDVIFCGYDFPDADSEGRINGMTFRVAHKTGDTTRKISDYKVVFDDIYLDDIANETYSIKNSKISFDSEIEYDLNSVENAGDYYKGFDGSYIEYTNEELAPQQDITMEEIIANHQDEVNANLEGQYENVLKRAFGGNYSVRKDQVTSYQWDLGEVNDNNEIQHARLIFLLENNNNATLYVYNVNFDTPISINDLKDSAAMSSSSATYEREYLFSYDSSIQGTRTELVNAILQSAITDGFDYQNAEIIFKDNGSFTDPDLGTVERFNVVVKNENGIRQINFTIASANSDSGYISKINNGQFKVNDYLESVNYSNNLLDEYVTVEAENN